MKTLPNDKWRHMVSVYAPLLNATGLRYMVTGGVARAFYAEPRATRDIDIVIELTEPSELHQAISLVEFQYGELRNNHFYVRHSNSAYLADFFVAHDDYHQYGLNTRRKFEWNDTYVYVAPIDYVIERKRQYYKRTECPKHLNDIECLTQTLTKY